LSRRTTDSGRLVREAIALANRQIFERAKNDSRLAGMACVLTVVVLDAADRTRATVGHVGDSRLYALAPGEIRKVTPDHSPVGSREDAGEISEEEAMRHPRRNEIFRDVGSAPHEPDEEGWIDVLEVPFPAEGALLLCSDGLSDMIPSREILETVEANAASPEAAVHALIERANAAGGKDNVSAVLVLGDRFAEAMRRRPQDRGRGGNAKPAVAPLRGAGHVRGGGGWGKALLAGIVLALLLAALFLFRQPLLDALGIGAGGGAGGTVSPRKSGAVLVVGIGDGGFATISEALSQARPGQRIEVAPGQYHERITLRDGVDLVSRVPRGAVLLPPAAAGETPAARVLPAISASGVHGGRLSGFKVMGTAAAPWSVGVRLDSSEVELDGVEVTGMSGAGIEVRGADRSTVRYAFVHENGGPGIAVSGEAAPRLLSNLIAGNGTRSGGLAPGVEVRGTAVPLLAGNRIEGNGGGGVTLPGPERADEVFRWNSFATLPREQAVRAAPAPPVPPLANPPPAVPRSQP
ncbi:MAG TPA: right-handed parallel beta-helix repeat-containing protein, partial [Thermoanaerobaculia bacterium]|nr:right-handed parallel beta-helix repeat-containing protein [Thermoanaerobaculia bacterium]